MRKVIVLFLACATLVFCQYEDTCRTIDETTGTCITVSLCAPYMKMLQDPRSKQKAFQILRLSHCGFDGKNPKICCPRSNVVPKPPLAASAQKPSKPTRKQSSGASVLPEPPSCGDGSMSLHRVLQQNVDYDFFPWLAFLGYKKNQGRGVMWSCEGSLISSRHVLTAAHCIHERENELYVVRLGGVKAEKSPVDAQIKATFKHEDFNPADLTNDIGLVVLKNDVTFTASIKPICVPWTKELRPNNFENYNPIVTGWSDIRSDGNLPNKTIVLTIPVRSNDVCRKDYERDSQLIDERVLCAGHKRQDEICQYGGGPLMQPIVPQRGYTGSYYVTGVLSSAKPCGQRGNANLFTRVTHFVPWIEEKVLGR